MYGDVTLQAQLAHLYGSGAPGARVDEDDEDDDDVPASHLRTSPINLGHDDDADGKVCTVYRLAIAPCPFLCSPCPVAPCPVAPCPLSLAPCPCPCP